MRQIATLRHIRSRVVGMVLALCAVVGVAGAAQAQALAQAQAGAQGCQRDCLAPGDYSMTMTFGGYERSYDVHVPARYDGAQPVPLLLDLHGLGGDIARARKFSGQLEQSDLRGFILVWPQGYDKSWNGYGCCSTALAQNIDDVGFLRAVVAAVRARTSIDPARIYITGHSNGGSMTQRVACEAADLFTAAAPASFPLNQPDRCRPSRPISVLAFHGTADEIVNYYGISPFGFQGARQSLASWAAIQGCTGEPTRTQIKVLSRDETFTTCRGGAKVGLVTVALATYTVYWNADVPIADYMWRHLFVPPVAH